MKWRTVFTLAMLIVYLAVVGHSAVENADLARIVAKEAATFEQDRKWEAALDHYRKAAELHPIEDYRYQAAYAATQCRTPRWTDAEGFLLQNHGIDSLLLLATVYRQQRKWEDAQQQLDAATRHDAENPRTDYAWGEWAYARWMHRKRADDAQLAIDHYRHFLEKRPNTPDRVEIQKRLRELEYGDTGRTVNRAIRVFRAGEFDRAWKFLDDAEDERPDWLEIAYWRGRICMTASEANRHYDDTGTVVEAYLSGADSSPEAMVALADFYLSRGRPEPARLVAEAAVRQAPDWTPPLLLLGQIHQALGEFPQARTYFRKVAELVPNTAAADQAEQALEINIPLPRERTLAIDLDELMDKYGPEINDIERLRRLEKIVFQLYKSNGAPKTLPKVKLLASERMNAWGVPPDQLYITVGFVEFLDNQAALTPMADDILAFVLAHEWTHVLQRDYQRAKKTQQALAALTQEQSIAWELLRSGIGRAAEENADRHGLLFAYRAGYKPQAALAWCETTIAEKGDWNSDGNHPSLRQRQFLMRDFLHGSMQQAYQSFEAGVKAFSAYQRAVQAGENEQADEHLDWTRYAFEAYLRLYPWDSAALENLSVVYFLHGASLLEAKPWGQWHLAHEVRRKPDLEQPGKEVVITPETQRWWEKARRHATLALRMNPQSSVAYQILGDVALGFGDGKRAADMYQHGQVIEPARPALLNNFGVLEARRGNLGRAKALWTAVGELPAAKLNLEKQP